MDDEMSTRILLADPHVLSRTGLRKMLEERTDWTVVAEADDCAEAVRHAVDLKPDVAIIDIGMPIIEGIETTREIVRCSPFTQVLAVGLHWHDAYVMQIFDAGAVGYLLKDCADVHLLQAVETVSRGKAFLSPSLLRDRAGSS